MTPSPQQFYYHTERWQGVLMVVLIIGVCGVVLPGLVWKMVAVMVGSGPLLWVVLQMARQSRGIALDGNTLVIDQPLLFRRQRIALGVVRGVTATPRGGLGVLIAQPVRPEPGSVQQPRLIVTPTVEGIERLQAALLAACGGKLAATADQIVLRLTRRQRMTWAIIAVAILLIPVYIFVLARMQSIFGEKRGDPFQLITAAPPLSGPTATP